MIPYTYIHHQLMPWAWWHFRGACERCRYTRPPEGPASCWQWDSSWSPNVLIEQDKKRIVQLKLLQIIFVELPVHLDIFR